MEIAVGKYYRTRAGRRAFIDYVSPTNITHQQVRGTVDGNQHLWGRDGALYGDGREYDLDLIAPWPELPTVTNTPRPGEAPGARDRSSDIQVGDVWFTRGGTKAEVTMVVAGHGVFPVAAIHSDGLQRTHRADGRAATDEGPFDLVQLASRRKDLFPSSAIAFAEEAVERAVSADLHPDFIAPGYEPLASVLQQALDQAQAGKGKERHANGRAFLDQPIMEIGRMVGVGYQTGQAMKKAQEAMGMLRRDQPDRAVAELLGAINYMAAAILTIRENEVGA